MTNYELRIFLFQSNNLWRYNSLSAEGSIKLEGLSSSEASIRPEALHQAEGFSSE